jgi:CxxC-x17-CxxC domain-containing protein
MYTEQILVCADCGAEFPFTVGEQEFYAQKGFTSAPRRCKNCRSAAKQNRTGGSGGFSSSGGAGRSSYGGGSERQMYDVTCDQCGVQTQVPFKPNGAKPVYCRDCFRK